jgi:hypothetical protein
MGESRIRTAEFAARLGAISSRGPGDFIHRCRLPCRRKILPAQSRASEKKPMKLATLFALALGCSLVHASALAKSEQPNRMSICQKEATASGKKGDERKAVLRACMSAGKNTKAG